MWVRGLKQFEQTKCFKIIGVAPYVGAWIETCFCEIGHRQLVVAPYVGAWIETYHTRRPGNDDRVAPYVGAWIETSRPYRKNPTALSHPMWVRGLKLDNVP